MTNEIREYAELCGVKMDCAGSLHKKWSCGVDRDKPCLDYRCASHEISHFSPFANTDHCLMGWKMLTPDEKSKTLAALTLRGVPVGRMGVLDSLANSPAELSHAILTVVRKRG